MAVYLVDAPEKYRTLALPVSQDILREVVSEPDAQRRKLVPGSDAYHITPQEMKGSHRRIFVTVPEDETKPVEVVERNSQGWVSRIAARIHLPLFQGRRTIVEKGTYYPVGFVEAFAIPGGSPSAPAPSAYNKFRLFSVLAVEHGQ